MGEIEQAIEVLAYSNEQLEKIYNISQRNGIGNNRQLFRHSVHRR